MLPFAFNQVRSWLENSNKLANQNAIAKDCEIVYPLLCYCKTVHFFGDELFKHCVVQV